MKLRDLEAEFLRITGPNEWMRQPGLAGADGIIFLCPTCFAKNSGPIGTESVIVWFVDVPLTLSPGPGRWKATGTGLDDLTLDPSINVAKEHWHGCVKNGEVT